MEWSFSGRVAIDSILSIYSILEYVDIRVPKPNDSSSVVETDS